MGVLDKLRTDAASPRSVTTSVRFSEGDLARLDEAAKVLGTTRSKMIYESVMDVVSRHERQQKRRGGE